MTNESNIKQPLILQEKDTVIINFDEQQVERTDPQTEEKHTVYVYNAVRIPRSDFAYAGIVSAIVRSHYSESAVEAIVLNGKDTAEHEAEYNELQQWRTHAKEVAKAVLGEITN